MTQEIIQRINELYRKSQAEGLSEAEKKEQDLLRKEYIANVKKNYIQREMAPTSTGGQ